MMDSLNMAARRFGFGMSAAEADSPLSGRDWVARQLTAPTPGASGNEAADILARFLAATRTGGGAAGIADAVRAVLVPAYAGQALARTRRVVSTTLPVRERLTWFWSNHLAVSVDKVPVLGLAGAYEVEAIGPQVTARYADMLLAALRHPAMLLYLDNARSVSPEAGLLRRFGARLAQRGSQPGLNENLAREVLELHTLGVDGGYGQQDVNALARLLTGWSLGGGRGPLAAGTPGRFLFRERLHDPGSKQLLGRRYGPGLEESERALRDLAVHPATAAHLSAKLARYFLGEAPPALVQAMRRAWLDSEGDLGVVTATLISHEAAWSGPPGRFRPPEELLACALRLLGVVPARPAPLLAALDALGQRPWMPGSPAGWPQGPSYWASGDAMLRRIEWATAVARRYGAGTEPLQLAQQALGPALDPDTAQAIRRADSTQQGLALLLAGPAFQWS